MVEKSREVPPSLQPKSGDTGFDLDRALESIVTVQSTIPQDAFTAQILGTERAGSGVVIGENGLVLTIGYLVTEAENVWLRGANGIPVPAHPLAIDQETGFALVQALGALNLPTVAFGSARAASVGDPVVMAGGGGGRKQAVRARIVAKQEFSGYWEYHLNEAIFTTPAHPLWGGAGLLGPDGRLLGIGSLHVQQVNERSQREDVNMIVPIDLLPPILDDLLTYGRVNKPARPWLGVFSAENGDDIIVASVAERGPAAEAGIRRGDVLAGVGGSEIENLGDFYRKVWSRGPAGVEIPLEIVRDGRAIGLRVRSADRSTFMKRPRLQ
jgi:S1-C subfamily serine protease